MSVVTTHFVIGKRITLHVRIGGGENGNVINFDSDELCVVDEPCRLHQVLVHIKHVLIPDVARMIIDRSGNILVTELATAMLNSSLAAKEIDAGLTALVAFLTRVMCVEK